MFGIYEAKEKTKKEIKKVFLPIEGLLSPIAAPLKGEITKPMLKKNCSQEKKYC